MPVGSSSSGSNSRNKTKPNQATRQAMQRRNHLEARGKTPADLPRMYITLHSLQPQSCTLFRGHAGLHCTSWHLEGLGIKPLRNAPKYTCLPHAYGRERERGGDVIQRAYTILVSTPCVQIALTTVYHETVHFKVEGRGPEGTGGDQRRPGSH